MPHRSRSATPSLPEGFRGYAVLEPSGAIRLVPDLGTAVERAQHAAGKGGWTVEADVGRGHEAAGEQGDYYENPPLGPQLAQQRSGLPTLGVDEILRMPLAEAHAQVAAYFSTTRWAVAGRGEYRPGRIRKSKSGSVAAYQTARLMVANLLRVNAKLKKTGQYRPGVKALDPKSVGLMLVPEKSVFRGEAGNGTRLPLAYTATQSVAPLPSGVKSTLCVGATEECASTCLAYSGMNVQLHNTIVKLQTTQALMGAPQAFYRVLLAAIDRWFAPGHQELRFLRLNVLSDLPWELLIPDLFARYPGRMLNVHGRRKKCLGYDYTAVPGRVTPEGYDLTFSYKGTDANKRNCATEAAAGRRIAVVFMLPGRAKERRTAKLPTVWDGPGGRLPVVDGDLDDFRPLDPDACYVGLRFKTVAGGAEAEKKARQGVFVVQVAKVEVIGGQLVATETPRQTGVDPSGA